ncbi:7-ethoxycoumarin O-deethylase-like [Aristolochia californica]|uniref:7-ethoxycoumarin O-deethylase-like n=1 Tax=Aristolochia californica TaxID=171875 RepID=UPI0035DEEECD
MRLWWSNGGPPNLPFFPVLLTASLGLFAVACYILANSKSGEAKLPLPPGPVGFPLLGSLPFLKPDLHVHFAALARTYGPIMTLQLGRKLCIIVTSPSLAKEVLKDQDATFANRDVLAAARALPNGLHGMGWAPYGLQWRMLRKITMSNMLNQSGIESFHGLRREEVRLMLVRVYEAVNSRVNFGELVFVPLFNVLTGMLWGGSLKEEILNVVGDVSEMFGRADVSDVFPVLARLGIQGVVRKAKKVSMSLDQTWENIIHGRITQGGRSNAQGTKDLLEVLLETIERGNPKMPLKRENIKGLFTDLVLAGLFTTSTMMEWAMTEMLQSPETMSKAQKELDQVVGMNCMVEETHLPKLHYLNALIKEVLRLHPTTPLMLPRTPSQTSVVGGYTVPKGSCVLVNIWAIERDPIAWDRPLEFDPDRFLTGPVKWDYSGNDLRYFPYGSGRRICPGMYLADRMMAYGLATLLHSFEWRLPAGEKLDVSAKLGAVLKRAKPLLVVPTLRQDSAEHFTASTV